MIDMNAIRRETWVGVSPERFCNERFEELMRAIRYSKLATLTDLARAANVHRGVLKPGYGSERSFERVQGIAQAAAELLQLDVRCLALWLYGEEEPQLAQRVAWLATHKCTKCGEPADAAPFIAGRGMHRHCTRDLQTPHMLEWMLAVDAAITSAPAWLQRAWQRARESSDAITYTRLAQIAHKQVSTLKELWAELGLPSRPAKGNGGEGYDIKKTLNTRPIVFDHQSRRPYSFLSERLLAYSGSLNRFQGAAL